LPAATSSTWRDALHLPHQVVVAVVDAVIRAERAQPRELLGAGCGGDHGRTGALGELDRGQADASAAALHQHGLTGAESTELEQTIVCRAERNRRAGDRSQIGAIGNDPAVAGGDGAQLGVRAGRVDADHALADAQLRYLRTDLDDLTRRLIADHVRPAGERGAGAMQQIAALDADRGDADHDAARRALRVGHFLVAKHARRSVLVVDGGSHGALSCGLGLVSVGGGSVSAAGCASAGAASASLTRTSRSRRCL
jgi:hypothetical protein